jgi:hypothetical protein
MAEAVSILSLLRRLFSRALPPHFRRIARVPELPDMPDELAADIIYVVGSEAAPKWAVLLCPCERGHPVTLRLQPGRSSWRVTHGRRDPSIYPSIDVRGDWKGGARCHYWVRQGEVHWVPEWWSEPTPADL